MVLAALQKFGEVVTYQNFRYNRQGTVDLDQISHAIFKTTEAATSAIKASPITIPIPPDTDTQKPPNEHIIAADPWAESEFQPSPTSLTCQIQQSFYNNEAAMKKNPYYNTFYVLTNSSQYHDLVKCAGIPQPELADCSLTRKKRVPLRIRQRVQQDNERLGALSLMELYREGIERERTPPNAQSQSQGSKSEISTTVHPGELGAEKKTGRRETSTADLSG
jgi:hypothetical protein